MLKFLLRAEFGEELNIRVYYTQFYSVFLSEIIFKKFEYIPYKGKYVFEKYFLEKYINYFLFFLCVFGMGRQKYFLKRIICL